MQETSDLYKELLASEHTFETRLTIGETGALITKQGEKITFGGTSILIASTGADSGYDDSLLMSVETSGRLFSNDMPTVGNCIIGQIDIEMLRPIAAFPEQSRLAPYIRITDGFRFSEWIQRGVFYIDTRNDEKDESDIRTITIHGYDDMRRTEQDYPDSKLSWPAKDIDVIKEIASFIDVSVDPQTVAIVRNGYLVQYPAQYSCREVLGYIAAMYGGNFVMSAIGELRLVTLFGIPAETRYLIAGLGQAITFGGVRILV